jgi:hypothetical protein
MEIVENHSQSNGAEKYYFDSFTPYKCLPMYDAQIIIHTVDYNIMFIYRQPRSRPALGTVYSQHIPLFTIRLISSTEQLTSYMIVAD